MRLSTDAHIISCLLDRGQMTVKEIAHQAGRHSSVVHRCLTNLERIGMVERERKQDGTGHPFDVWRTGKRLRDAKR